LFAALHRRQILVQVHYVAVNDMPLYRKLGHDPAQTPIATAAAASTLSLPLYPSMSDADVDRVIDAVRASLDEIGAAAI
jgi:dTDP-4-amino-4,6-dideoxygalactose transaminase